MTIIELLDKAKTRANITSDYALAKIMGVDRRIVSDWRKGKKHPSTDEAVKLATLAGLEEMPVIAQIEYQTATTEKKKQFWKCYLEQHGIAAGLCMVTLGISILLTPEPAQADVLHLRNYDAQNSVLKKEGIYIMRNRRKVHRHFGILFFKAIFHKLAGFFKVSPDHVPSVVR